MSRTAVRIARAVLSAMLAMVVAAVPATGPASAAGTWTWPVRGPVVRGFDPPASPYGAGHRGIDIAAPAGTPVVAPAAGVVSFAGRVAGQLFVSLDHGAGLVSTASYLGATLVDEGDPVTAGQPIGSTGAGHAGAALEHLHFGVRLGGIYVDPLDYLSPASLVGILWLAPILSAAPVIARSIGPGLPGSLIRFASADGQPAAYPPSSRSLPPPAAARGRPVLP
jgi:murein DD-endopeptidase MepM/ murein hydrolase activator NlpD